MFMDFIVPGIGDLFDLERFDADVIEKVSKYCLNFRNFFTKIFFRIMINDLKR